MNDIDYEAHKRQYKENSDLKLENGDLKANIISLEIFFDKQKEIITNLEEKLALLKLENARLKEKNNEINKTIKQLVEDLNNKNEVTVYPSCNQEELVLNVKERKYNIDKLKIVLTIISFLILLFLIFHDKL